MREEKRKLKVKIAMSLLNPKTISEFYFLRMPERRKEDVVVAQVSQARNISIGEHRHCCVTFQIEGFAWGKSLSFL